MRYLSAATALTALIGGVLLGRATAPAPQEEAVPAAASPSPTSKRAADAVDCDTTALEDRIAELERALKAWELADRFQTAQRDGTPAPFPEDWAAAYTDPDRIAANTAAAVAECGLPVEVDHVDCTEAPCQVWLRRLKRTDRGGSGMAGCEAWRDTYTSYGSGNGSFADNTTGDILRYEVIGAVPPGWKPGEDQDNMSKRNMLRLTGGREALMDAWDAREPTSAERLKELELQLEDPDLDEDMRPLLEMMRDMLAGDGE